MRTLVLLAVAMMYSGAANALGCADFQRAQAAIQVADTKAAIAIALIGIGVSADDASNLERSSPDADVARTTALRYVIPRTSAVCAVEQSKK